MAVDFDSTEKIERGHSYWFTPQDIHLDVENNGRHDLPNIDWLIASIKANGQTTPCLIRKDGMKAVMVEGHSRWRAVVEINKTRKPDERLKVWCVYFRGNEVDALMAGFAANKERNSLTAVDEGYFVGRLIKYGKTYDDIAGIVHETPEWCKRRHALVTLVPEAQEAVASGALKPSAALTLSKLSADLQRKAVRERTAKGKVAPDAVREATGAKPRVSMVKFRLALDQIATGAADIPKGLELDAIDLGTVVMAKWVLKVLNGQIQL